MSWFRIRKVIFAQITVVKDFVPLKFTHTAVIVKEKIHLYRQFGNDAVFNSPDKLKLRKKLLRKVL